MTPQAEPSPSERAARLEKAYKIADWLTAAGMAGVDYLAALGTMNDEWWEAVARRAHANTPSLTTRGVIIGILQNRAEQASGFTYEMPKPDEVQFVGCDQEGAQV